MGQFRPNVLISSAGRRGELVEIFRRSLAMRAPGTRIFTADASRLSAAGLVGDGHHLVPRVSDPGYLDALADLCTALDVGHVVPTIDTELPVLSEAREYFAASGTCLWVSGPDTITIARDKRRTHKLLHRSGLPRAEQWDLATAPDDLASSLPLIAKPARGSSSVGLLRVESVSELQQLRTVASAEDYVVETIARGMEYTVDVLVDSRGQCQVAVPRRRLEVRAGEVSKGVTVDRSDVADMARAVVTQLPDAFGVLNVQVFADDHGPTAVIEINARFGGGFPLTHRAGADVPSWLVDDVEGRVPRASLEWTPGLVMLRYDRAVFARAEEVGVEP